MASVTYTRTRTPERRRTVADTSPARTVPHPTDAAPLTDHERSDTTQLWSWSATAVMWGYGPSASAFL
ncbi:hypothetical protein ABZ930_00695 [Streptomyces sp. NPDC046716]|uniref:hypothetical protein n=1 Tax=Streptomyces sp. NPDC046716 TaxID=3157093 RepID=UPI0033F724B3